MATMKDIANLVGVSLTTVSNVVHGNYDRVSPQTVQRILDAIEQLHYVPNMSARALVSHSSRIIAFVDTHSPQETYAGNGFAGVLLSGLEGVVTDHGYFLMMRRGTNEDVLRLMLNNWNPDGVIFKDRVPQSLVDFVKKQGKPCVTINTYLDDPELIQVRAEDRRGGYLAAKHLIDLGHRNILFIGAGAFHIVKPTDLIPELQGRFPIRVTLDNLSKADFVEILTKPENALIKQHKALLETEGIEVEFTEGAIDQIATISFMMNEQTENIGARRLHTILEKLLEDISFNIPEMNEEKLTIDEEYVKDRFKETIHAEDLDRYIL